MRNFAFTPTIRSRTVRILGFFLLAFVVVASPAVANASGNNPVSKRMVGNNIFEYTYIVPTGRGPFHKIGVHRVVQEKNGRPISAKSAVFMAHGDVWNFDSAFLGSTVPSPSIAVYLAGKGVDVWGIDFGWTLVPDDTTDFSFMQDWGLQRDIDDLEVGLGFARAIRAVTGSGFDRLNLLAWSRGGWIGYGLLNQEAQRPAFLRQVRGFIPVDTFFKVNDQHTQELMCAFERDANDAIAGGTYAQDARVNRDVGRLAETDPDGISPIFGPPFTNMQISLLLGGATYDFGESFTPFYHFTAAKFVNDDPFDFVLSFTHTDVHRWDDFLISASAFESLPMRRDTYTVTCNAHSTPFDNHLNDVTVPVLYVGAAGGFGAAGVYSLSLLGSKDVQTHVVSLFPPDQQAFDFGHLDLFYAKDADKLVWSKIHSWLSTH